MKSYFTIEEICKSSTADRLKINNVPVDELILTNINTLISYLNTLRIAWSGPINISSGYRCPELNKAVGGSKTSSHCQGLSADIKPKSMDDFDKFAQFCREFYKHNDFDQCILETVGNKKWIHIGFGPKMRKQFLCTTDGKTYKIWNLK